MTTSKVVNVSIGALRHEWVLGLSCGHSINKFSEMTPHPDLAECLECSHAKADASAVHVTIPVDGYGVAVVYYRHETIVHGD